MKDYRPKEPKSNHRPNFTLDDCEDVTGCVAILRFMRNQRQRGQKFYFFSPLSTVGDMLIDLMYAGYVEITPGKCGSYWMAEVLR